MEEITHDRLAISGRFGIDEMQEGFTWSAIVEKQAREKRN